MNLNCKQSIAAQYEIVRFLAVGGEDLIDDIAKLKQMLSLKLRTLKFGGEFTWDWAADRLIHVRLLPSYSQIRDGLAGNVPASQLQITLDLLRTEKGRTESAYDWALCIWLLSEISILKNPIMDEVVAIIFKPLSKNSWFMDRVMFLAQHFISSKGTSAGAIFSLPFLMHMVRLNPDDARVRFEVARAQIDAHQYQEAVETLVPIDIDGSDLPGQVPYCGEADLLAEESFLRGRALSLLGLSEYTELRRKPHLFQAEEARRALEYAVSEEGQCHPQYLHGLGQQLLDDARLYKDIEHSEGFRCVDMSLELAHFGLLNDLRSKLEYAHGELFTLLTGPIMKAAVQRQELRLLRSLVEWARDHNTLDTMVAIEFVSDSCAKLLVRRTESPDDWAESCSRSSCLMREMDFDDFQSMLRVEACQILEIFGIGDYEAKLLTKLANDDADELVKAAARKALSSVSEAAKDLSPKSNQDEDEFPSWMMDEFREGEALRNRRTTVIPYESSEEVVNRLAAKYEASRDVSAESQKVVVSLPVQTQEMPDSESPGKGTTWSGASEPNVFFLAVKGTPMSPQFVIETRDGKVWDGTGWNDDSEKGLRYSDAGIAARLCHEMQRIP